MRLRPLVCASVCGLLACGFAALAHGQDGFALQLVDPVVGPYGLSAVEGSRTLGHLQPSFGGVLNYASRPLSGSLGGREVPVVDQQLAFHVQAGLGVWERLQFDLVAPLYIISDGMLGTTDFGGFSLGDVSVRGKGSMVEIKEAGFGIGLSTALHLPTGEEAAFTGTGTLSTTIKGVADLALGPVYASLNAGVRLGDEAEIAELSVGSEVVYGAGARVALRDGLLDLGAEVLGRTLFSDPFGSKLVAPLEGIVGVTLHMPAGIEVTSSAGGGLIPGYGTSTFRTLFGIRYTLPQADEPREAAPSEVVLDGDDDGFIDAEDACPTEPEDLDSFEDKDGCPDPDNDGDGLLDEQDECPDDPGLAQDKGCPPQEAPEPEQDPQAPPEAPDPSADEAPQDPAGPVDEAPAPAEPPADEGQDPSLPPE